MSRSNYKCSIDRPQVPWMRTVSAPRVLSGFTQVPLLAPAWRNGNMRIRPLSHLACEGV